MNTTRSRTRLFVAVTAAVIMLLTLVPAGPVSAGQVMTFVDGYAYLSNGVAGCGWGTFDGTLVGVHGTTPVVQGRAVAEFQYCSTITSGTAVGTANIAGHVCNFAWQRVGVAAVAGVTGCHTPGTVVAAFLPLPAPVTFGYKVEGIGVLPL